MTGRLILVSNRLPITVSTTGSSGRATVRASVGGLATGVGAHHDRTGGLWIGWPGSLDGLNEQARHAVDRQLASKRLIPVTLTAKEVSVYYERIANGVLWPVCHDRLDQLPLRVEGWDVYERVNARFADVVAAHWRPGDLVWVHDYQLLRVPALLRARIPEARIGFFLHIPFPMPELFFALPSRRWLVEGMLGADLIGFHTRRYRGHFAAAVERLFHLEAHRHDIAMNGRHVRLGVFPMGIDAAGFARRADSPAVRAEVAKLRGSGAERLLVGIDRLDYSKGIPRRLAAVDRLLTTHPEWRERVRFIQVAVPSREGVRAYQRLREQVESQVGRMNGAFASPTWVPVHYVHRTVSDTLLVALYRAADAMIVTPMRDGMNLVAKEFVASRTDEDGALVLSEFAGAAEELTDALVVNPYDVDATAEAVHAALTMPRSERRARMRALRTHVMEHDVRRWAGEFIDALGATR